MGEEAITVEIGYQPVVITKLYGPLIFADLRITPDPAANEWVIEREWIESGEFLPWCRIPGQIKQEMEGGE